MSIGHMKWLPQIAYIGGPPKTRQFFRPHPPADSQRIRWWDAGKMAIGLCHVPLAESAQTASGWASGHWRHAGGFRSRQAGRDGQPALHQRISFEPDGHKRDPPVRRPFITLAVWTIRCFFPDSYSYLHSNTTGTLSFCGWSRNGCAWDVTTTSVRRWRHNRKYENIIVSWYQWDDFFWKVTEKSSLAL